MYKNLWFGTNVIVLILFVYHYLLFFYTFLVVCGSSENAKLYMENTSFTHYILLHLNCDYDHFLKLPTVIVQSAYTDLLGHFTEQG